MSLFIHEYSEEELDEILRQELRVWVAEELPRILEEQGINPAEQAKEAE